MALTKVGHSNANYTVAIAEGGQLTVTFIPDTTFEAGDLLLAFIASGARSSGSNYTHLPGHPTDTPNGYTTGWNVPNFNNFDVFWQNTPYWGLTYHTVTSGEAGSGNIVLTVTLGETSTLGGSTGYILAQGGVAVRGADSVVNVYCPPDNNDYDNVSWFSAATGVPVLGTNLSFTPPYTGMPVLDPADWLSSTDNAAIALIGAQFNGTTPSCTSSSWAFVGATEIDDDFVADVWTAPNPDEDFMTASAYALVEPGVDIPQVDITWTHTHTGGGNIGAYAFRALIEVATPAPETPAAWPPPYEPISRKVSIKELPHEVNSRMFDNL